MSCRSQSRKSTVSPTSWGDSARRPDEPSRACGGRDPASVRSRARRAGRHAGSPLTRSSRSARVASDDVPIELEVHDGLAVGGVPCRGDALEPTLFIPRRADDRVQDPPHRQAPRGELLGHGVDQEGRVVDVRLQDRALRREAVGRGVGIEDADDPGLQPPPVDEVERTADETVELLGRRRGDLVVTQAPEVAPRERGDRLPTLHRSPLLDHRQQRRKRLPRFRSGCSGGGPLARRRGLTTARSLHRVRHVASRMGRYGPRTAIVTDAGDDR